MIFRALPHEADDRCQKGIPLRRTFWIAMLRASTPGLGAGRAAVGDMADAERGEALALRASLFLLFTAVCNGSLSSRRSLPES